MTFSLVCRQYPQYYKLHGWNTKVKLSPHFNLIEFLSTSYPQYISAPVELFIIDNLKALCEKVLEPLRIECGSQIFITSGYRNKELNEKVGGVPTSKHLTGEACDFKMDSKETPIKWIPFLMRKTKLTKLIYYVEEKRFHVEIGSRTKKRFLITMNGEKYHDFSFLIDLPVSIA